MKVSRILISVGMVIVACIFAASAFAITVNITNQSDSSMSISNATLSSIMANGDVLTITVTGGTPSTCADTAPTVTFTNTTVNAVAGQPASNTFTVSDPSATVSASIGSVTLTSSTSTSSTYSWSYTPATTGGSPVTVVITVTDSANCATPATYTFSCNISASSGSGSSGSGSATLITNTLQDFSVPASGSSYYYFTLPATTSLAVVVYETTEDWTTIDNVYVSNVSQPSCPTASMTSSQNEPPNAPPWYSGSTDGGETVKVWGSYPAGMMFYVTVCNTDSVTSKIGIYYSSD